MHEKHSFKDKYFIEAVHKSQLAMATMFVAVIGVMNKEDAKRWQEMFGNWTKLTGAASKDEEAKLRTKLIQFMVEQYDNATKRLFGKPTQCTRSSPTEGSG